MLKIRITITYPYYFVVFLPFNESKKVTSSQQYTNNKITLVI